LSIKISELTAATEPLAGSEAVPIVQSGVTVRAPASAFGLLPTAVQGDLVYGSAPGVYSALAKDTSATRYVSNTGASNNPAWAQVNLTNGVTGDLPFANLTQIAGLSALGVAGNVTADVAAITAGTDNQVLRRSGATLAFGAVNLASSNAVTGALAITNGGTGETTANAALNALLPSQAAAAGLFLTSDGTDTSWAAGGGGGSGPLIAAGTFQPDGSALQAINIISSSQLGTGSYQVDFTPGYFTSVPVVLVTLGFSGVGADTFTVGVDSQPDNDTAVISMSDGAVAADGSFRLIAVGDQSGGGGNAPASARLQADSDGSIIASAGIDSVTEVSPGSYAVVFTPGLFVSAPAVTCTFGVASFEHVIATDGFATTTDVAILVQDSTGSPASRAFNLIAIATS
jgi:hypothetical protein